LANGSFCFLLARLITNLYQSFHLASLLVYILFRGPSHQHEMLAGTFSQGAMLQNVRRIGCLPGEWQKVSRNF